MLLGGQDMTKRSDPSINKVDNTKIQIFRNAAADCKVVAEQWWKSYGQIPKFQQR